MQKTISGARYNCLKCAQSYDLCSTCYSQAKTLHNASHTFQLIPDPLLRSTNRNVVAQRALEYFRRLSKSSDTEREPLSGWTKDDATKIIEIENEFLRSYEQKKQKLEQIMLEEAKREEERQMQKLQRELDITHAQNQMAIGIANRMYEDSLEHLRDSTRRLGGTSCPRCGAWVY